MSGYLQRLAASALRPAEAVHPVLGSVFSPQEGSTDHPSFPQEEDTALSVEGVTTPLVSLTQPSVETQQTSSRPSNAPDSDIAGIRSSSFQTVEPRPKSRAETRDSFEPLLPHLRNEASSPQTSPTQESLLAEPPKPLLEPAHPALVPAGPGLSSPTIAGAQALANSSSFRRHERSAAANRAGKSQPDEIQIHIGRIEVTAVPQTSQRTASKPARKGITLEEYLKGRDRRV
jgi:hypothetical protein